MNYAIQLYLNVNPNYVEPPTLLDGPPPHPCPGWFYLHDTIQPRQYRVSRNVQGDGLVVVQSYRHADPQAMHKCAPMMA